MTSETYKELTLEYAKTRNDGLENASNLTDYEYEWANLSGLDGFKVDENDFNPISRLNKKLTIEDYKKND